MTISFEDFYRTEYPKVFRGALAFCGDREIASEATQEAFARAFARWRRLSKKEWSGGWAMTTALNHCRKLIRKSDPSIGVIEQHAEVDPTRVDVTRAIQRLSEKQRQAVVLNYIGDLPIPVVAELMDLSEGTIRSHLARAREALRKQLEVEQDA